MWGIQALYKRHLICILPFIYNQFIFNSIIEDCLLLWHPVATVVFGWVLCRLRFYFAVSHLPHRHTVLVSWLFFFFFFTLPSLLVLRHTPAHTDTLTDLLSVLFKMTLSPWQLPEQVDDRPGCFQTLTMALALSQQRERHTEKSSKNKELPYSIRVCGFVFQCGDPGTCEKSSIWSTK